MPRENSEFSLVTAFNRKVTIDKKGSTWNTDRCLSVVDNNGWNIDIRISDAELQKLADWINEPEPDYMEEGKKLWLAQSDFLNSEDDDEYWNTMMPQKSKLEWAGVAKRFVESLEDN